MNILFYVSCFLFCSITASNNSKCTLPKKSTKSRFKTTQETKTFEKLPPITKKKYNQGVLNLTERLCTVPEKQVLFTKDQPGNSPRPGNDFYRKRPKFSLSQTNRKIVEENEIQVRENIYTPSPTDISFAHTLVELIHSEKYKDACNKLKGFSSLFTFYVAKQAQEALNNQNQKILNKYTLALRLLITEKMRENLAKEHF